MQISHVEVFVGVDTERDGCAYVVTTDLNGEFPFDDSDDESAKAARARALQYANDVADALRAKGLTAHVSGL